MELATHQSNSKTGRTNANGRILDPTIGRFMSVDPMYQAPTNSQSVSPYSYVMNNPLSLVDPSGYAAIIDNNGGSGPPIGDAWDHADKYVSLDFGSNGGVGGEGGRDIDGNLIQTVDLNSLQAGEGVKLANGTSIIKNADGTVDAFGGNGAVLGTGIALPKGDGDSGQQGGTNAIQPKQAQAPQAISRGDNAILTDKQIGNIVFNETRSLSGPYVEQARETIADAVINGDEKFGPGRPTAAHTYLPVDESALNKADKQTLAAIRAAVAQVRIDRANGLDLANGATKYGLRDLSKFTVTGFEGMMNSYRRSTGDRPVPGNFSVVGPMYNSFHPTGGDLGPKDIYLVLFERMQGVGGP